MAPMVSRPKFDAFLVEKAVAAGARIAEGEAFREMRICLVADDPLADESFGQNMREPVELRNHGPSRRETMSLSASGGMGNAIALRRDFARQLRVHGIDSDASDKGLSHPGNRVPARQGKP